MKVILFILLTIPSIAFTQQESKNTYAFMLGPMVHFNIADHKVKPSYGLEISYWNLIVPLSIDLGGEWEKGKIRTYSELQTGIYYAGCSFGPVYEYNYKLKEKHFGIQGSVWANAFLGFDARVRRINKVNTFSPGTYLKLPAFSDIDLHNE